MMYLEETKNTNWESGEPSKEYQEMTPFRILAGFGMGT